MKYSIISKTAIAMLLISLCFSNTFTTSGNAQTSAGVTEAKFDIGETAPDFSLPGLDGNMIGSTSLNGKFVVIHFATTWCPFCNAEAPHLEQLHLEYKDRNVQVLIIDVMEPKKQVAQKLRDRFNLSFPVLLDEDGVVATSFAPSDALPDLSRDEVMLASNLIIDPNGKIRYMSLLDSQNFDAKLVDLKKRLNELLREYKTTGSNDFIELKDVRSNNLKAGEQNVITLSFKIKDGYHIQANKVNDDSLIPVKLDMESLEGISFGQPSFPDWKQFQLAGTKETLRVFDDITEVKIPVSISHNQRPGEYFLKGNLQYQACDSGKCFFPRKLEFNLRIMVA